MLIWKQGTLRYYESEYGRFIYIGRRLQVIFSVKKSMKEITLNTPYVIK